MKLKPYLLSLQIYVEARKVEASVRVCVCVCVCVCVKAEWWVHGYLFYNYGFIYNWQKTQEHQPCVFKEALSKTNFKKTVANPVKKCSSQLYW